MPLISWAWGFVSQLTTSGTLAHGKIVAMFETLYKTNSPATSPVPAEFYELGLKAVRGRGKVEYQVIEIHGWWDDNEKRVIEKRDTFKPDVGEGYQTYDEAQKRYAEQKEHRAKEGFVHLFRIEIPSGQEIHEEITID